MSCSASDTDWLLFPVVAPGPLLVPERGLTTAFSAVVVSPVQSIPLHDAVGADGVCAISCRGGLLRALERASRRCPSGTVARCLPSVRLRTCLVWVDNDPSPASIVAVLLDKVIVFRERLNSDNGANRGMSVIMQNRGGYRRAGPAFLVALLVASTAIEETCCQGDEVDPKDDNDRDANWVRPVETILLLFFVRDNHQLGN